MARHYLKNYNILCRQSKYFENNIYNYDTTRYNCIKYSKFQNVGAGLDQPEKMNLYLEGRSRPTPMIYNN